MPPLRRAKEAPCLRRIDLFHGSGRHAVHVVAARHVVEDPASGSLLADPVDEPYGSDRAACAGSIDPFPGSDRARVPRAIIASPGFTGDRQLARIRRRSGSIPRSDRRKILGEIATSPRATQTAKDGAVRHLAT